MGGGGGGGECRKIVRRERGGGGGVISQKCKPYKWRGGGVGSNVRREGGGGREREGGERETSYDFSSTLKQYIAIRTNPDLDKKGSMDKS